MIEHFLITRSFFFLLLQQIRSTFHWLFRSWPESHQYSKYFHGFHRFPTKGYLICKNQTKMESLRNTNYLRTAPQLGRKTKSKMLDTANQKQTTLFYIRNNQRKFFLIYLNFFFAPWNLPWSFPSFPWLLFLFNGGKCQLWPILVNPGRFIFIHIECAIFQCILIHFAVSVYAILANPVNCL